VPVALPNQISSLDRRGITSDRSHGNPDASQTPVPSPSLDVGVEMMEIVEVSESSIVRPDIHIDVAHNSDASANPSFGENPSISHLHSSPTEQGNEPPGTTNSEPSEKQTPVTETPGNTAGPSSGNAEYITTSQPSTPSSNTDPLPGRCRFPQSAISYLFPSSPSSCPATGEAVYFGHWERSPLFQSNPWRAIYKQLLIKQSGVWRFPRIYYLTISFYTGVDTSELTRR
jgi:hypothetical protein